MHTKEYKSLPPDGGLCGAASHGLLRRYPVTASEFILIGKETERCREQAENIITLLPSLMRYDQNTGIANQLLRERLKQIVPECAAGGNRVEQEYDPSRTAGRASTPRIAPAPPDRSLWFSNGERSYGT